MNLTKAEKNYLKVIRDSKNMIRRNLSSFSEACYKLSGYKKALIDNEVMTEEQATYFYQLFIKMYTGTHRSQEVAKEKLETFFSFIED